MSSKSRIDLVKQRPEPNGHGRLEKGTVPPMREPTLDQIFAEPIVQQLMQRDEIDEATIRHLLQETEAFGRARWTTDDPGIHDCSAILSVLHETARLWCSRFNRELRAQLPGMTCARCAVLTHLARHEGSNQAALAQILHIAPITLTRLLDRLEAAGLVARLSDPESRRTYVLALTTKARPLIKRIDELATKMHGIALGDISDAETGRLLGLLCQMRSNLLAGVSEAPDSERGQQRGRA